MGDSRPPLGPRLGRVHALRNRGAVYTEGLRTSLQAGLLGAGVAKGAGFTDTAWATYFGLAILLGIELAKVLLGWLDYRFHVIQTEQRIAAEASPVTMRMVHALEALVPK